jgi:phosphoserine aminotransferase
MVNARGYNFGAGPSCLPESILKDAQLALWNWQNTGMSIIELGHRTSLFVDLMAETESLCRQILNVPNNYQILFMGGAARAQFGLIPLNILSKNEKAAYAVTGIWSEMAYQEIQKLLPEQGYLVASSKELGSVKAPKILGSLQANTKYFYFTPNETITGFYYQPDDVFQGTPWVADMTSCLFAQPVNFDDYGLVFAGAQKNIANAGLTLVIVKKDWLQQSPASVLPTMMDYRTFEKDLSLYATPPTFNIFLMNLMMKWVIEQGGVEGLYAKNLEKAQLLYDFLDNQSHYKTYIHGKNRSIMNVSFTTGADELDNQLIDSAAKQGLLALRGHRFLGGLRASIYNPMPLEGVKSLIEFLSDFQKNNLK